MDIYSGNWYYVHMTYSPLKGIMLLGLCWFKALSSFQMVVQSQLQHPLKGTQRGTDHAVNHSKDLMMLPWIVQFLLSGGWELPYLWTQTQNWMMIAQLLKVAITTKFQKERNFLARRFLTELPHHVIYQMRVDGDPNLERWVMIRLQYPNFI